MHDRVGAGAHGSFFTVWLLGVLLGGVLVCGASSQLNAQSPNSQAAISDESALRAATERMTYNAGEIVRLRIVAPPSTPGQPGVTYLASIRYAGEDNPFLTGIAIGSIPSAGSQYRPLWQIPRDARTGRYELDLQVRDSRSQKVIQEYPRVCSFAIHRQQIQIVSVDVGRRDYTDGDAMGCSVQLANLGDQPRIGLRVEFSERYWPWIAQQKAKVGGGIRIVGSEINLKPHLGANASSSACAVATGSAQPTIKQYAAVVWDHDRRKPLAIAFSPLVFINPPGVTAPRPYPPQYVYPDLAAVNTSSYRHFRPEPLGAAAIQFDTHHTQFPSGGSALVKISIGNPTDAAWPQISARARLLGPDGQERGSQVVANALDLPPHGGSLTQAANFSLPAGVSGLFHVQVDLTDASGRELAVNSLELGVNPLPQSVLFFCAHEDDEGAQMGFIRSLVENQIPLHMIYYTSGDAGGCDRYFQHSCGPEEALNFGAVRMQEVRAAMAHLGVPAENILFLGLPDGGSGEIWYNHASSADPYQAVLLASDHAPYEGLFRPNLPFSRQAVVNATEEIIRTFHPEVIFTAHPPAEGHIDHIVNNYFVVKALQELLHQDAVEANLEVRVDKIFDPKGYPATPYHYEDHTFYVSGDVVALAQEAGWYHQSQGGNRAQGNLRTWDQLPRSEEYRKMLDWNGHEGWNDHRQTE